MTKLLQAQTEISAQAHTVAMQSSPALSHFTRQDVHFTTNEDSFDRSVLRKEAGWQDGLVEQQLCPTEGTSGENGSQGVLHVNYRRENRLCKSHWIPQEAIKASVC